MRPAQPISAPAASAGELRRARLLSLLLIALAGGALWLAVPRFAAGVASAPFGDVLAALDTAGVAATERAERGYRRALRWQRHPQIEADLGALSLGEARRETLADHGEAARVLLAESAALHRASLAQSPLQPYAWTRLAQTEIALEAPQQAVAALRMALDSGPMEPALVVARLSLSFVLWNDLDDGLRTRMAGQIRHAAKLYPMALARIAVQRRAQDKVLGAIEDDTDLLRRFSQAYSLL